MVKVMRVEAVESFLRSSGVSGYLKMYGKMLFAHFFVVEFCVFAFCSLDVDAKFASDFRSEQLPAVAEYIRSYVPLQLPKLMASSSNDDVQWLEFAAWDGRQFRIGLRPIAGVVSSATNVSTVSALNGRTPFDVTQFADDWRHYEGRVDDDPQSLVSGHVVKGLFNGFVNTANETYYLEPSKDYFAEALRLKHNSILYKASDVYVCPSLGTVDNTSHVDCIQPGLRRAHSLPAGFHRNLMSVTPFGSEVVHVGVHSQAGDPSAAIDGTNKLKAPSFLCDLRIICDFRWYRYVTSGNTTYGIEVVVSLLRRVDQMFRALDLDGDGRPENVGFFLHYLDIYIDPVLPDFEDIEHWYAPRFFTEFGAYDFGDVCAGLLLTYRQLAHYAPDQPNGWDSDMPTVPKTNLASLDQGICSQHVPPGSPTASQEDYGDYVANALPVNFMSWNSVASASSIVLQTAHQLGHLFGARDDTDMRDGRCQPDENDLSRNYIMGYPLVSADAERNFMWSPCSQVAIETFLRSLEQQERPCLKPCHDANTCLKDLWTSNAGDSDHGDTLDSDGGQQPGLGVQPRENKESDEVVKKQQRDADEEGDQEVQDVVEDAPKGDQEDKANSTVSTHDTTVENPKTGDETPNVTILPTITTGRATMFKESTMFNASTFAVTGTQVTKMMTMETEMDGGGSDLGSVAGTTCNAAYFIVVAFGITVTTWIVPA